MKKVMAALLALFIVVLPATGYAAAASFALNLSAKEVLRGGEITFSGTAEDDVVLKIIRPNQTTFYMDVIEPAEGTYSSTITIPETQEFAPWGVYKVVASSGSSSVNKTFSVVEKLGEGGTNPDPGNGGGTTPPATTIPADAGDSTGSVIKPELGKDGYIFGSGTLASAISSAQGSVTVELPAATGDAGSSLNFPAETLKTLKDKNLDLIIISGNSTLRFPAGSLATSDTSANAQIRIVVNTLLTNDAKSVIDKALQANKDYASTGVVISATIQSVNGSNVTEIHNLDKPAEVTLKLTPDQAKQIGSDLAGVYYVNGTKLEYVGGKLKGDTFTFKTNHFSTYTILEYNKTFADLSGKWAWAAEAVKALSAKHIVTGVDEQHYAPSRNITRAEFATMIMRTVDWTEKASVEAGTNPFKDVPAGQYYTDAVTRAAKLGIVNGYGGAFRPNDPITREEAVVALMRAAKYFELTSSGKGASAFTDAKQISAWAKDAVEKAWAAGLIEGDGKLFHPKQAVTRAEVAVMLNRLLP
ncbi:S-layer homology domain-containing protein [Paenibacillus glycanilyticus]|uniref:S-layer homology domain-containing protein n=1 Tax=Paenibacillus glycanilyticus TaxID=126569 RepID=UPI002040EDAB|nr:S-layer homology domain-containing protein [Paenibacillus glycanilyticus]MCM3631517.1 S-layer homology domain-containing protein [Paenibacillus glycanilyticus]